MTKFTMPPPPPKKVRAKSPGLAFRLDDDLVSAFHDARSESGLSVASFLSAMIRHCLKDLGKL